MKKEIYSMHAEICKIFSNPTRLELLNLLRDGELTVSVLVKRANLSQANVSQHLGIMKSKGILQSRRAGASTYYKIVNPKVVKAFDLMRQVLNEMQKPNIGGKNETWNRNKHR
ncbi:winged helix-turn-helix transcriptional regulator [Candidatus Micrarchaeota archaeon]|nr:winged helix-turn-helix transcriptional regulator [Candidatus Micrarchaeota archaeon]